MDDEIRAKVKPQAADSRELTRLRRQLLRWGGDERSRSPVAAQRETLIASGSARSCCSRRRWRRLSRISSDFWPASRRWHPWRPPTSTMCCDCGKGWGTTACARNLHAAARQVVRDHAGVIPDEVDTLQSLPGIGRYTAGAIASFAYDRRAPVVEANTLRVYMRLLALREPTDSTAAPNAVWEFAERAVPLRSAGKFNEALMDLGATICVPVCAPLRPMPRQLLLPGLSRGCPNGNPAAEATARANGGLAGDDRGQTRRALPTAEKSVRRALARTVGVFARPARRWRRLERARSA